MSGPLSSMISRMRAGVADEVAAAGVAHHHRVGARRRRLLGERQRRRRQVGHVENRDVGVGVVGHDAGVVGLAVDLDGDALGAGDDVRVGHHPVRRRRRIRYPRAPFGSSGATPRILTHAGPGGGDDRRRRPAPASGASTVHDRRAAERLQHIGQPGGVPQRRAADSAPPQPVRRHLVDLRQHLGAPHGGGQIGLIRRRQEVAQQPRRHQHRDHLQPHADHRVEDAQGGVADGAAHGAAQHHTRDLADHHQRRGSGTASTNSLVRGPLMWLTTCGASSTPATAPSTTPTNASSEPSAPDRQPEMAATKAIAEDGEIKPLRRCHCCASP